jgi:3-dehydroquinate dehydratase I
MRRATLAAFAQVITMKLRSGIKTNKPLVVGTVHDAASLLAAPAAGNGLVDLLELRVDAFADEPALLLRTIPRLKIPLLVTVRDAAEGGTVKMSARHRMDLFDLFLPHAAMIDVELRNVQKMAAVISHAKSRGVKVILSFHDFRTTPTLERLHALHDTAREAGADVFKVAARTDSLAAVMRLAGLLEKRRKPPCSVMGMGGFGKVSRLLFASGGSVLNYACLGEAQVPGQWPAGLFKKRISELA